jgi:hypothetical protein
MILFLEGVNFGSCSFDYHTKNRLGAVSARKTLLKFRGKGTLAHLDG